MDNKTHISSVYRGADYSDGLKHWKYIKRYRGKNGKYVYVYADKKTHGDIKSDLDAANTWNKDALKVHDKFVEAEANFNRAFDNGRTATNEVYKEAYANLAWQHRNASEYYSKGTAQYMEYSKQYSDSAYNKMKNNSVNTLSKKSITKGKATVSKFINKIKSVFK